MVAQPDGDDDDPRLAVHIRRLLLDYARTHLTTDYVQFTQLAVSELVSLVQVPTADPTALTLPTDPFDTLTSLFQLNTLPCYDEIPQTKPEALLLLKRLLKTKPGKPKSERAPYEHGYDDITSNHIPMSPAVLTLRTQRETPLRIPHAYRESLASRPMDIVLVEPMREPDVKLEQVLGITLDIRAADHTAVRALLKSVTAGSSSRTRVNRKTQMTFSSSLAPEKAPESPPFLPIFPRRAPESPPAPGRVRSKHSGVVDARKQMGSILDLPAFIGGEAGIEDGAHTEGDLYKENMVVVDGWHTFSTSSPSRPGSGTSMASDEDGGQVDQLFLPSSPDTDVGMGVGTRLVREVEDMKMEPIQMPRSRRIGGAAVTTPAAGIPGDSDSGCEIRTGIVKTMQNGLGPFITSLIIPCGPRESAATTLRTSKLTPSASGGGSRSAGGDGENASDASTRGQPSAAASDITNPKMDTWLSVDADADVDVSIRTVCAMGHGHGTVYKSCRPEDYIRDERLVDDDKTGDGGAADGVSAVRFMPIPILPAPNTIKADATGVPLTSDPNDAARVLRCLPRSLKEYVAVPQTSTVGRRVTDAAVGAATATARQVLDEDENMNMGGKVGRKIEQVQQTSTTAGTGSFRFLKKAKGLASLRVALSWIPFTVSSAADIPAHAGVLDVLTLIDDAPGVEGTPQEDRVVHVKALLRRSFAEEEGDGYAMEVCRQRDDERGIRDRTDVEEREGGKEFSPEIAHCEIVLTRAERMGLAVIVDRSGVGRVRDPDVDANALIGGEGDEVQREGAHSEGGIDSGYGNNDHRPTKRRRLGSPQTVDDSGIGMELDINAGCDDYGHDILVRDDNDNDMDELAGESGNLDEFLNEKMYLLTDEDEDDILNADKENLPPVELQPPAIVDRNLRPKSGLIYAADNYEYEGDIRGADGSSLTRFGFDVGPNDEYNQRLDYGREYDSGEPSNGNYGGCFEPLSLSFDSHQANSAGPSQTQPDKNRFYSAQEELYADNGSKNVDEPDQCNEMDGYWQPSSKESTYHEGRASPETSGLARTNETLDTMASMNLDLANHSLGINAFAKLRAKVIKPAPDSAPLELKDNPPIVTGQEPAESRPQSPSTRTAPDRLYDRNTLRLPLTKVNPTKLHRYMASLDVLQKQVLVRSLRSRSCLVNLVERHSLGGVDLILDSHNAVIFAPLLSLPSQREALLTRLAQQSWMYGRLLIVFEAYPAARSYRPNTGRRGNGNSGSLAYVPLYAYTPPILKAIKKLRRDVDIAEACGTKSSACVVGFAFADTVDEAAAFARYCGDLAEEGDSTGGAVWGDRTWLDVEMSEDEESLASVGGMNPFRASIVLCQADLQAFLDLSPMERVESFGPLIGIDAVASFNADIEQRSHAIEDVE